MKHKVRLTLEVTVTCDKRSLPRALKHLREHPPHIDTTVAGYDGPFDARGFAADTSGRHDYVFSVGNARVRRVRL